MNRKERRAQHKLARHATSEEIFHEGTRGHGPIQSSLRDVMPKMVRIIQNEIGPAFTVTLFIAEIAPPLDENREARFSYCSSAERADMIAVLEAFIKKQREVGEKLDKIEETPPTETPQ